MGREEDDSLEVFQNFNLLNLLFFFFSLAGSKYSDCGRCSIDNLLLSLKEELLISRDRLAMLERLRRRDSASLGSEQSDAVRYPGLRGLARGYTLCMALVMVDRDEVREGTSSTETRSSGPGSPKRGDGMTG